MTSLPPLLSETLQTSRALRSTGITPLRRYYGPIRHPLAVRPLPRIPGYSLDMAPPLSRWGEEGFSSCSTCPRHRAVAITPPEWLAASARCDDPCCLRLSTVRLGLRGFGLSGPPVRSLPLRPGDSLTLLPRAWSVGFRVLVSRHPATQVTGLWLLPRRGCLPLNTSAFSGRTVDDELELRRPLHGQFGGLRPFQDSVHEVGGSSVHTRIARPKGQQSARLDQFRVRRHRREPLFGGEVHDALAIVQEKTIPHHAERPWPRPGNRFERLVELAHGPHLQDL